MNQRSGTKQRYYPITACVPSTRSLCGVWRTEGRGRYYRKIREEMRVEKCWSHRFNAAIAVTPNDVNGEGELGNLGVKGDKIYFEADRYVKVKGWKGGEHHTN